MLALPVARPHCHWMAKTWMPKNDSKARKAYQKAFEKAMRALVSPKGRRNTHFRPR